MGASDLRVTVDSAKLRCVLDPALALGHALGPRLALGLTRVFETWLTRSFWQVLDSSELLPHRAAEPGQAGQAPDASALGEWIALREATDAGSWLLRWVGDCLAESQLRSAGDESVVERFEWLAQALQERDEAAGRSEAWCVGLDPLAGALDALALSATLEGALILCPLPVGGAAPGPVQALARLGLAAESVDGDAASLFAAERVLVREALAGAGLAALLQPLGRLAAVHVLALPGEAAGDESADPWLHARAWWYPV
ncbi:hypothetical protein [Ramlibacter sp. 2FC]|uniref:hypothetical protein n=1 Tax=Ramlibacter sp. 2FC TaxID=2502188 RepID=UPI0010F7744F|nr:hypothetical protein [Ramlibacter sp. 2FC]